MKGTTLTDNTEKLGITLPISLVKETDENIRNVSSIRYTRIYSISAIAIFCKYYLAYGKAVLFSTPTT